MIDTRTLRELLMRAPGEWRLDGQYIYGEGWGVGTTRVPVGEVCHTTHGELIVGALNVLPELLDRYDEAEDLEVLQRNVDAYEETLSELNDKVGNLEETIEQLDAKVSKRDDTISELEYQLEQMKANAEVAA